MKEALHDKHDDDINAPQQKPRSGNTSPYVSPPDEMKISSNPNERANENIRNVPFEKTGNTDRDTGDEITDGEAG